MAYLPGLVSSIGFGYSSGYGGGFGDAYSLSFSLPLYIGPSYPPVYPAPIPAAMPANVPANAGAPPQSLSRQAPPGCLQTREYQTEIVIDGQALPAYGTACLQADGSWRIVSGPFASN
jgi:hypothetical protein